MHRAIDRLRRERRYAAVPLADAEVVASESADAAESLRSYGAIVFRGFDDWPGRSAPADICRSTNCLTCR